MVLSSFVFVNVVPPAQEQEPRPGAGGDEAGGEPLLEVGIVPERVLPLGILRGLSFAEVDGDCADQQARDQ